MTRLTVTRTFMKRFEIQRKGRHFTLWPRPATTLWSLLQGLLEEAAELADDAAPERQNADDKDDALHDGDPCTELREIVLHRQHDERPRDRAEYRAEAADQRHQHDLARHGPVHGI